MKLSDQFAASDDVVAKEVGGEMVLMDLRNGQYFGLDPVGGRIWDLLSEKAHALAQLCDFIEDEFDAPRAVIEADVLNLAADLKERELIAAHPE